MGLSKRLRELREKRGLSQEQLADILNIPRSSISIYENSDERTPRRERLESLADFFGVSVDYLLGRDPSVETKKPSSRDKKDLKKFLEQTDDLMYDGIPVDKDQIEHVLEGLFWEAKKMNKRKKPRDDKK
ncbi:helix-turn-helix domain-containing protein [Alicyclobacillus acidoterrestris]|uniref:helix-turn-helix domain-containing protein n=1 Tax=Alicyclobacillus acidoterrestris TaxID=1450 RepID=UPI003F539E38